MKKALAELAQASVLSWILRAKAALKNATHFLRALPERVMPTA